MKNVCKIILSIILCISIILCPTSCTKEQNIKDSAVHEENCNLSSNGEKSWWSVFVAAAAVVAVIVKCAEGQYHKEVEYYQDGTIKNIKEWCDGIGHCAINASNSKSEPISSVIYDVVEDFSAQAMLIKCSNGNLLMAIEKTEINEKEYRQFFYDKTINISRPIIIDNSEILKSLRLNKPCVIQGDYAVETITKGKRELSYITIHE